MRKRLLFLVTLFCCLDIAVMAEGVSSLLRGEGAFTYKEYAPFADRPVDVHYYIPSTGNIKQMRIVFVFEGGDRGYSYLLKAWKEEAEKKKFMVFIPHFDLKQYPLSEYQEAGVFDRATKTVRKQSLQTPALIDKIFESIRKHSGNEQKKYVIYGHSAGGQFVQRFMLFYDSPYVEKAIIGSPGWYTLPDASLDFPYGIRNVPYITPAVVKKYLAKNIVLQLATGDTVRESFLRKTPEASAQGRNRYERGNYFYNYVHKIAGENKWPCHWMKVEEQGVGHQSVEMGQRSVPYLLGDSVRALFIGNSYTFFNKMPQMVKSIAASSGKNLAVKMVANGGWTLKQHTTNAETLNAIKEGGWDFVVLQEHSQGPSREKEWVKRNVFTAAYSLDSIRRLYAPDGNTVFYMTWGHETDAYVKDQQLLAENYLEMATKMNAWCAPVGVAWKRVRNENSKVVLYDSDHSHPSIAGSYLVANIFCSVFFQKAYTSSYDAGLFKDGALYLQRTAQETVLSNLSLWKIHPVVQPNDVSRMFYPESSRKYNSPTLSKPLEEGLASLFEIKQYLQFLAKNHSDKMKLDVIGYTPQGREIPIIYFSSGGDKKKTKVWIQGGLHGNEPAGPEAVCILADYLLNNPEGLSLLDKVDLALVPVANPDGYSLQRRNSGSDLDLNRDQSKLADPVSLLLKRVFAKWNPEVTLDIHEFNPIRKDFKPKGHKNISVANDVLFLLSGHPNIPIELRNLSADLFRKEANKALKANGFTSGFYFTFDSKNGIVYAVKDGKSPQSSSTSQALANAASLFIELRGIGLGRTSFSRRAESGFIVARSLLKTVSEHQSTVEKKINAAIKETCSGNDDVCVTFYAQKAKMSIPFIDFTKKRRFLYTFTTLDALRSYPVLTRKRPASYILSNTCIAEAEKLRVLGIKVDIMSEPFTETVQKYIVTKYKVSDEKWEKINPVKVTTTLKIEKQSFPAGCFVVNMSQKNANLAATLLEPESDNGFVAFCVTKVYPNKELPIYRRIK